MKILNIEPFQETLHAGMCGPASLKMILSYFGINKTEKELAKLCETDEKLGTSAEDLVRVIRSYALQSDIHNEGNLGDIEKCIQKDIPVIVNWFSRGRTDYGISEVPDGHYSVVIGIDKKYIYLQDPEIGKQRKIERDDFLTVWFDFSGEYISRDTLIIRQFISVYR